MTFDVAGPLNTLLSVWFTLAVTAWLAVAIAAGWLAEEKDARRSSGSCSASSRARSPLCSWASPPRGASGDCRRCRGLPRADPP